ncbi:MAG: hypothetical protein QOF19_1307, partial [Alphaproteobacteria bacterium]|nr:hypothetical protein [Alphaproteobacteria bacterium]
MPLLQALDNARASTSCLFNA